MNPLVIKILAVGLTLSQLMTRPNSGFKSQFSHEDQKEVSELLHQGCVAVTKEFGAQKIDFDVLFSTMIANLKAQQGTNANESLASKLTRDLDFNTLYASYKQFCKNETVADSPVKLDDVIDYYDKALVDLPDYHKLKGLKLPQSTLVLDDADQRFTEIYQDNNRRSWVPVGEIPDFVKKAFVAAEDKRFYKHHGFDVHGIIRAFMNDLSGSGRPQGGSTITQQVVKNLLVGDDLTFARKIREMVLATRVETILSKDEILGLYLNYVFLGRASWGINMAAESYFGKKVAQLDLAQAAFLAGMTKGPNYYDPIKHSDRSKDRTEYVLYQMKQDGYINQTQFDSAMKENLKFIDFVPPHARAAYYFLDEIKNRAKALTHVQSLSDHSFTIHATLDPALQKAAETALQDGLADYEQKTGRAHFTEPEENVSKELEQRHMTWKQLLPELRGPLYDVHWPLAIVLQTGRPLKVGLEDGSIVSLEGLNSSIRKQLHENDIVFVRLLKKRKSQYARLRIRPRVQGAIIIMENKTGRVLALSGGFSYPLSQLDRVTQTARQTGSTLKPFIYLAALNTGFQPNTLIPDSPIDLPPLDRFGRQWWRPHDYETRNRGLVTIREAVERSLNLPTAHMMSDMGQTPAEGLDYIRGVTQELGIYKQPIRFYPFVLGAQPARLLDMATAYAAIANDGLMPTPHFIDRIEEDGRTIYQRPLFSLRPVRSIDRVSFYQVRRILEGVVSEGTAYQMHDLSGFVAGKTGTSNNEHDAWFMGFTKDITVGVWVGYDDQQARHDLGARGTGADVALPIFEQAVRDSFKIYKPKEPLPPPPSEIQNQIVEYPIDHDTGTFNEGNFMEVFRKAKSSNQPLNTRMSLLNPNDERELAVLPSSPGGDENDLLGPDTQAELPAPVPQQYGYDRYRPAPDESQNDTWRRERRQVDPEFHYIPFFANP